MSAATDVIQVCIGVAALGVSVLALRENRLQRRATERTAAPADTGGWPVHQPPAVTQPPYTVPDQPPPQPQLPAPGWGPYLQPPAAPYQRQPYPGQSPVAERPAPRLHEILPYSVMGGAVVGLLANALLSTPGEWLIGGLVVLAVAIGIFVRTRLAPGGPSTVSSVASGCLAGASLALMLGSFGSDTPVSDSLVSVAVVVALMMVWIIINRVRSRRDL